MILGLDITYRTFDKVGLGIHTPEQVAQLLAILAGLILAIIGALRLGLLVVSHCYELTCICNDAEKNKFRTLHQQTFLRGSESTIARNRKGAYEVFTYTPIGSLIWVTSVVTRLVYSLEWLFRASGEQKKDSGGMSRPCRYDFCHTIGLRFGKTLSLDSL